VRQQACGMRQQQMRTSRLSRRVGAAVRARPGMVRQVAVARGQPGQAAQEVGVWGRSAPGIEAGRRGNAAKEIYATPPLL